ncbi:MAG: hypothetical protein QM498_02645 [Desulfobacterium sp.]
MTVPAYQIQNILTLYCRKLEQSWHKAQNQNSPLPLQINVIAKNKKKTVINKVKESIVAKITLMGPRQYMELHAQPKAPVVPPLRKVSHRERHPFSFIALEKGNVRLKKTISLENDDGM